jgi:hypothetical protein
MVSHGGGRQPHWRGDGKELFYIGPDNSDGGSGLGERRRV